NTYDSSKGKLFTWMLNVARNTAIDKLRSKEFKKERMTVTLDNNASKSTYETDYTRVDHLGLNNVLNKLKEDQQQLLDLAYFKGYTQEEIAQTMGMPIGSVKTKIRNTLIYLREIL